MAVMSEEKLKMTCTGTTQFYEHAENNRSFLDILNSSYTFSKESNQVSAGQANTDIQRVLRTIKAQSRSSYEHQHVAAHQDKYTYYEDLELEAKLNCAGATSWRRRKSKTLSTV